MARLGTLALVLALIAAPQLADARPPTVPAHAPAPPPPAVLPKAPAPPPVLRLTHAAPPRPIEHASFSAPAIDRRVLRASNRSLDDDTYERKVATSLESPFMFFRSFNGAFHRDMKDLAGRGVPGGTGPVAGDPHPDNFGFLRTGKGTEYAFNDYDDSGRGPVAIDAVRYFTAVRLAFPGKERLLGELVDHYVAVAKGTAKPEKIPEAFLPDWDRVHEKALEKVTANDAFVRSDKTRLSAPTAKVGQQVRDLIAEDPRFGKTEVLDVALRTKDYGGSAGQNRIWALVSRAGRRTILEFKGVEAPAVNELGGAPIPEAQRLALAKATFLEKGEENNIFSVELGGKLFMVRDRTRMQSVDIGDLTRDDRRAVLTAQAGILGRVHASGWANVDTQEMTSWIARSSETLADRWTSAYDAERAAHPGARGVVSGSD